MSKFYAKIPLAHLSPVNPRFKEMLEELKVDLANGVIPGWVYGYPSPEQIEIIEEPESDQ